VLCGVRFVKGGVDINLPLLRSLSSYLYYNLTCRNKNNETWNNVLFLKRSESGLMPGQKAFSTSPCLVDAISDRYNLTCMRLCSFLHSTTTLFYCVKIHCGDATCTVVNNRKVLVHLVKDAVKNTCFVGRAWQQI
jgi:hypothetical protein